MKSLLIILLLFLTSCKSLVIKDSYYVTDCKHLVEPRLILNLGNTNNFSYKIPYYKDTIIGNWKRKKDTLILSSLQFSEEFREKNFIYTKYTSFNENEDAFLIRGRKLYRIDSTGNVNDNCPLFKK